MNRSSALKIAYRAKDALNKTGLGKSKLFSGVKHRAKTMLVDWVSSDGPDGMVSTQIDGHTVFVPSSPYLLEAYVRRPFEPFALQLFKSAIGPGFTVLDIGSHLGVYSLVAARGVGTEGRVFAFEPDPSNFRFLLRNTEKSGFKNIEPVQKAVGDRNGTVDFFLAESSDCNSLYVHPQSPVKATVRVECITLDGFLAGRTVNVIKMDVEGNECKALQGLRSTILNSENLAIFVELNPPCLRSAGATPEELITLLEGFGFSMRLIDEDSAALVSLSELKALQSSDPDWYGNLYCVKQSGRFFMPQQPDPSPHAENQGIL